MVLSVENVKKEVIEEDKGIYELKRGIRKTGLGWLRKKKREQERETIMLCTPNLIRQAPLCGGILASYNITQ